MKSQEQVLEDRPLHQPPSLRLLTPFYSTMLNNEVPNTRDHSKPIGYTIIGVGRLTEVGLEELREEPLLLKMEMRPRILLVLTNQDYQICQLKDKPNLYLFKSKPNL